MKPTPRIVIAASEGIERLPLNAPPASRSMSPPRSIAGPRTEAPIDRAIRFPRGMPANRVRPADHAGRRQRIHTSQRQKTGSICNHITEWLYRWVPIHIHSSFIFYPSSLFSRFTFSVFIMNLAPGRGFYRHPLYRHLRGQKSNNFLEDSLEIFCLSIGARPLARNHHRKLMWVHRLFNR